MAATSDIKLIYGVDVEASIDPIRSGIIEIVNRLNDEKGFNLVFGVDESSFENVKNKVAEIAQSLGSIDFSAMANSASAAGSAAASSASSGSSSSKSNKSAKNKEEAQSEKELADAVNGEAAAEEKRKISLTQVLKLYETLQKIQNENTHMKDTAQYKAVTDAIIALSDVYDKYKDRLTEIPNLIEKVNTAEFKLETAFDKGTMAVKQFNTALPTSADGVKVQSALRAINSAVSQMGKFENADGNKENTSYLNLLDLVKKLEGKLDDSRTAFKKFGTESKESGEKVSEIMRQIAVETENVKNETIKASAAKKAKEAADAAAKKASEKAAEAEKESAAASDKSAKKQKEREISLRQFLDLYKRLKTLENDNKSMANVDQYKNVIEYVNKLETHYQNIKGETADLINIIDKMGATFVSDFDMASVAAKQLEAAIPGQSAGIKYETVLNKINEINGLLGSEAGKKLAVDNNELWQSLQNHSKALESTINRTTKSFIDFGSDGAKGVEKIVNALRDANIAIAEYKGEVSNSKNNVDPYNLIVSQADKIGKTMKNARKLNLEGTPEYSAAQAAMNELNSLIDRNTGSLKNLGLESDAASAKISGSMSNASRVMSNLNNVINQTDKQTQAASMSLDKFIAMTNKLDRAANGKTANSLGLSADKNSSTYNATYEEVLKYIQAFRDVQVEAERTGKSVESILNSGFVSGMDASAIEKSAVAYQKLQTILGNASKSSVKFNTEEKERQALLGKSYGLLNQTQQALKNWSKAATGKSQYSYNNIKEYNIALNNLINQFKNGAISSEDFSARLSTINEKFKADAAIIKQCGEATTSFGGSLAKVARNFSMWFSMSAIIMRVYRSLREMVNMSIELDDAMTQLKIVTTETEAVYKSFGDTLAKMAKETAVSITDLTSSATTYARLGYTLEEAAKIAEYTAKLQNVGDIDVSDAQDAITAIIKAYDGININNIEDVMNKLVVTGNNFPISVSQIAEGMNNASSALAAAGNTFEQSVALLTAANTTINLCRVA